MTRHAARLDSNLAPALPPSLRPPLQAQLAAAGVLCGETSVHHIIARSSRGVDHPLNYFLIDRGPNSVMGSRVEGFRGEQRGHARRASARLGSAPEVECLGDSLHVLPARLPVWAPAC